MISEKYKNDEGRQGHSYVNEFTGFGFTSVDILPNLIGKPWNDVALGYVHGMNPTHIRVIDGRGEQLDAQTGRVTIHLNSKTKLIESIDQEIRVGLPEGIPHGQGLHTALEKGIDSEQVKWEVMDCEMVCSGFGQYYKLMKDGTRVYHPDCKNRDDSVGRDWDVVFTTPVDTNKITQQTQNIWKPDGEVLDFAIKTVDIMINKKKI
jgi:hypothetical protein